MKRRLSRVACSLVASGLIIASPVYASDETEALSAETKSQTEVGEQTEEVDLKQQFLTDIAAGLNKRWEDNDKLSADESTDEGKKKSYEIYVDDELQYVDKYRDTEFDDAQFDKLVAMYINGVDLQKKALEYFDDYKLVYNELWGAGYCARATATVDLVDYYKLDLPVDDVREFRDSLANDALVYNLSSEDLTVQSDTQSTSQEASAPLSIVSEEVKDASYGTLIITCGITNDTDKTISNINLTMAGYDDTNTVIAQGYGYLSTPLEAGQTANIDVSFTADDSIDTARMKEILQIADRVSVLHDGQMVMTKRTEDTTIEEIISEITSGSRGDLEYKPHGAVSDDILFSVKDLSVDNIVKNISFSIHKGEVVGLAGLMGSGRTETAESIFGIRNAGNATFSLNGKDLHIRNVEDAIREGIALVPEDRRREGLILEHTLEQNICLTNLEKIKSGILTSNVKAITFSNACINKLKIKAHNCKVPMISLSGGNQQKAVIVKWLTRDPKLLIMDEPTAGVDIGAKGEVIDIIRDG